MAEFEFAAELWLHHGSAGWRFVTLPHMVSDEIADEVAERGDPARRGFGSVRVEVSCGATTWRTSLFPDRASRSYVLPVKQAVRLAEGLDDGDLVRIRLQPIST